MKHYAIFFTDETAEVISVPDTWEIGSFTGETLSFCDSDGYIRLRVFEVFDVQKGAE